MLGSRRVGKEQCQWHWQSVLGDVSEEAVDDVLLGSGNFEVPTKYLISEKIHRKSGEVVGRSFGPIYKWHGGWRALGGLAFAGG